MEKIIDLSTLRLMIAELQKDGFTEISIYDLLTYIIPVAENREEVSETSDL